MGRAGDAAPYAAGGGGGGKVLPKPPSQFLWDSKQPAPFAEESIQDSDV